MDLSYSYCGSDIMPIPAEISGQKYLSLTTFRKTGAPVRTPLWFAEAGGKLYFLSGRAGPISIFSYDPATKAVAEVYHNTGPDIRSLASDGRTLIDRFRS